jgi:hypothetical protein
MKRGSTTYFIFQGVDTMILRLIRDCLLYKRIMFYKFKKQIKVSFTIYTIEEKMLLYIIVINEMLYYEFIFCFFFYFICKTRVIKNKYTS